MDSISDTFCTYRCYEIYVGMQNIPVWKIAYCVSPHKGVPRKWRKKHLATELARPFWHRNGKQAKTCQNICELKNLGDSLMTAKAFVDTLF